MTGYRSLTDIAKTVRQSLKAELPDWKFSVTTKLYSGGGSITLALMSGPEEVTIDGKGYAQLNHYNFTSRPDRLNNGCYLSHAGWDVMKKATEVLAREHWDKSDAQIDYFCCAFYMHVEIGKWDVPYRLTPNKEK
jgi:hypothetical protein